MQITRTVTLCIEPLTWDYRELPSYDPARLLDMLREVLQVPNDAKLAHELRMEPGTISKLRHRRVSITPPVFLRMHDVSGLTIENLRDLAGIPQWKHE